MSNWLFSLYSHHILNNSVLSYFLIFANLNEDLLKLSCGFNLHSSTRHRGLVSFPFFFNVPYVLSAKCLFKFVAHFSVGLFVFFLLSSGSSLWFLKQIFYCLCYPYHPPVFDLYFSWSFENRSL